MAATATAMPTTDTTAMVLTAPSDRLTFMSRRAMRDETLMLNISSMVKTGVL